MLNRKRENHNDFIKEQLLRAEQGTEFNYINPSHNDKLSDMSGLDLQELLWHIEKYYLRLRKKLGFDDTVTFGLELEFEYARTDIIHEKLRKYLYRDRWKIKPDITLMCGDEINSPILKDTEESWYDLGKICEVVREYAQIDKNSGGHVHVGTQVIGDKREAWLNFIKFWSVYENVIYRFTYGDYLTARPDIKTFAEPVAQKFWEDYLASLERDYSTEVIIHKVNHTRRQAVNFDNVRIRSSYNIKNTVEFRCPNGSLNPVTWQNNVNLFVNILEYAKSSRFDDDIVTRRHEINLDKYSGLSDYNEIYLEQALELCDMVFTNNLDKVYFLKQYLKSFQVGKEDLERPARLKKIF